MSVIELLQRVGLNKYEADAYATLLAKGPLTGYELGKRSGVPLSRSYEIVERLAQKGLALAQPGEPPRYAAIPAGRFVRQVRAETLGTVDALAAALAAIDRADEGDEFWVARGRAPILALARALIDEARDAVLLHLPAGAQAAPLFLLADGRRALAGCLEPPSHCQAVTGGNAGLLAAVHAAFRAAGVAAPAAASAPRTPAPLDWVAWEDRKQRRVWQAGASDRVA